MRRIRNFTRDESGAVTTDWVVLTAGVVSFGLLVMMNIGDGVTSVSQGIANNLNSITVGVATQ